MMVIGRTVACLVLALESASLARADLIVYDNLTTATGSIAFGGVLSTGTGLVASLDIDDITVAAGFGGANLSVFTFVAFNPSGSQVVARPSVYFWAANGSGGNPGTLLGSRVLNDVTFPAQNGTAITSPLSGVTVPANGQFWAGIVFDDHGGTTGISANDLNNLGAIMFNPVTIGSSDPARALFIFGDDPFAVDNPLVNTFPSDIPLNYGWRFTTAVATGVPEPGSLALLASAALSLGAFGWRKRSVGR